MQKYNLEFILTIQEASVEDIRQSLANLAESLEILETGGEPAARRDLKISLHTEDPALVFDTCSGFGKLKSVKID